MYLKLCEVTDTPFHNQGRDDIHNNKVCNIIMRSSDEIRNILVCTTVIIIVSWS